MVFSYQKTKMIGSWRDESIIVTLVDTASIAKMCVPITQIQKLVRLKHPPHHLCAVCTATPTATYTATTTATHCNTLIKSLVICPHSAEAVLLNISPIAAHLAKVLAFLAKTFAGADLFPGT